MKRTTIKLSPPIQVSSIANLLDATHSSRQLADLARQLGSPIRALKYDTAWGLALLVSCRKPTLAVTLSFNSKPVAKP
jgi:hypothetical protein